jgi:nucleotide-binding universal stress UspA family protein
MIKGKSPFPFETIAMAVAFSPRLEELVAETSRLQSVFNARIVFIHVGKKTSEKQKQLTNLLNRYGFGDNNCRIYWEQGNVTDCITRVCKLEVVDLLIMGALRKENVLKYYMGSVSRELARKAKCSVLLLTDPSTLHTSTHKIVVNGHDHEKTIHTINTAIYFSQIASYEKIEVANEVDLPVLSMGMADDAAAGEIDRLQERLHKEETDRRVTIVTQLNECKIPVSFVTLSGRSGHSLGQYAKNNQADLLVVNSPDHSLSIFDRIFTHDIEYLLSDLPCNLLIVHSRLAEKPE